MILYRLLEEKDTLQYSIKTERNEAKQASRFAKQNFFSGTPKKVFVVDITYLFCIDRTYYLNTILDLFNKEAVAWKIGPSPNSELCIKTLKLLAGSCDLSGCIMHSDGEKSYNNYEYRNVLKDFGIIKTEGL